MRKLQGSPTPTAAPAQWWLQPMAILAHQFDGKIVREDTPENIERAVRDKRKQGFDAEHLLLNHTMLEGAAGGDDPKAYLFKNRFGFQKDWLSKYLPVAKKHKLRVICYFNVHWFRPGAFSEDFYAVDASGQLGVGYGSGHLSCARSRGFRQWAEEMAEDLGRYPIDGVFLDGPLQRHCFCAECRAEFQRRYGTALPAKAEECPAALADAYAVFPAEAVAEFVKIYARGLQRTNPGAVLYINDNAEGSDGHAMAATAGVTHLVGAEGGFIGYGPLSGVFPFKPGCAAKILEARAQGRARVVFSDGGFKSYDWYAHPPGEIARMYASTIANGAQPWFLILPSVLKCPGMRTAFKFNRLIGQCRADLAGSESLAEAVLLHSPANVILAGSAKAPGAVDDVGLRDSGPGRIKVSRHVGEFRGLYAALSRSAYPFEVLEEGALLSGALAKRVRLIMLPGVGALSDAVAEKLRRFVAAGGQVLATFDSSLFNGNGERRPDFALADVFGSHVDGDVVGPSRLDYLAVTEKNPLTRPFRQATLPCAEHWWRITAARGAKALLYYHEKMPRRYAALPPVSAGPAAVLNRFGQGRALFIPSALGDHYLNWRFPDERQLILSAAQLLAPPPVEVAGGDEFVEATLRQGANGTVVLHLINWASGERPASRALPLGPLQVRVRLPRGFKARSVTGCFAAGRIKFALQGGWLKFTLPKLAEYELVAIRA